MPATGHVMATDLPQNSRRGLGYNACSAYGLFPIPRLPESHFQMVGWLLAPRKRINFIGFSWDFYSISKLWRPKTMGNRAVSRLLAIFESTSGGLTTPSLSLAPRAPVFPLRLLRPLLLILRAALLRAAWLRNHASQGDVYRFSSMFTWFFTTFHAF